MGMKWALGLLGALAVLAGTMWSITGNTLLDHEQRITQNESKVTQLQTQAASQCGKDIRAPCDAGGREK